MDEFMALIGAAPTKEEQQRRLAQLLRGRRSVGELGAISGDKSLGPFGANMIAQTDSYAKQLQDTRQNDIDDARTQMYYEGQLGHMGRNATENERHNKELERLRALEIAGNLEEARIRAAGSRTGRKMTDSTRNKIAETSGVYEGLSALEQGFKPEYTQILGPGPQSLLPNYGAQFGLGNERSKEAQQWWASWNEIRTLPWRNLLFGATLTPNEKIEWQKVDINPSMSPEQIAAGVARIKGIIRNKARNHARVLQADGFDPEDILVAYGESVLLDDDQMAEAFAESDEDAAIAELEARIKAELEAQGVEQP